MNVTTCLTMNYEQRTMNDEKKRTQNEPNLSCRSLWRSRIKPNFCTIGYLYCLQSTQDNENLLRNFAYGYQ